MISIQLLALAAFVAVHAFAGRLRFLDVIPRSRWLSMAGGISVAYVFMHLFPELAEAQRDIAKGALVTKWIEHHAYFVALTGLAASYGMERLVKESRQQEGKRKQHGEGETTTAMGVFWLHVSSFAIYNALIGYLLVHREEQDVRGLVFFAVAMALHFLVNDYGLRQDHLDTYQRQGRWVLATAVVIGWLAGLVSHIEEAAVGALFAFLAGGIVLNVMKEELPEERKSRFIPFALGAGAYTALLLLL